MELPENVDTGWVYGQFLVPVSSGTGPDAQTQSVPAQGWIEFIASIPYLTDITAEPNPVTLLSAVHIAVLDSEGYVCTTAPDNSGFPMYRGIELIATDDPDLLVDGWTWRVVYHFTQAPGTAGVESHSMALPAGAEIDLAKVMKVPSSPGLGTEQAEALVAQAEAAATEAALSASGASEIALQVRKDADAGLFDGKPGPAGPNTIPTDEFNAALVSDPESLTSVAVNSAIGNKVAGKQDMASLDADVKEKILDPASATNAALSAAIDPKIDKTEAASIYTTKETIHEASDPASFFSNIEVVAAFPVRDPGVNTWVQGFSINEDAQEIYVASQATNGTVLTISIRNMDGSLKSSKTVTITAGAFTESLPFFYSGSDLCFIVRTGASGTANTYSIFNYTTNTLGPQIPINGSWRIAVEGDSAVTSDAWTNTITTFWMYSWDSIKAGAPTLLATMPVDSPGTTAAKNQGLALVGSQIVLTQGSNSESPTFTTYSTSGRMIGVTAWDKAAFAEKLNTLIPGLVSDTSNYAYEAEGAASYKGRLVTGHAVSNNNPDAATFVLVGHGFIAGQRVAQKTLPFPSNTPWTFVNATGPSCRVCVVNGIVYGFVDGSVTMPDATATTIVAAGSIPEAMRPTANWRFQASIAGYPAVGYVTAAGGVVIDNKTGAARANINVSNFSYPLMRW